MVRQLRDWSKYRNLTSAFPDEAERGRLLTASAMAQDPEGRKRMEDEFGIEMMKQIYPEVYRSGWGKMLDRVRAAVKW